MPAGSPAGNFRSSHLEGARLTCGRDCQALQDEITALRRELHQIPEVGAQLPETAACLSAHLDRLGIPFVRSPRDSGLIASIQGGLPGRTVALRADMDALPIQEETGLPFSSRRPGVMHACGHDAHAAMLMGAAQVLQKHRKELRGTVRLPLPAGRGAV